MVAACSPQAGCSRLMMPRFCPEEIKGVGTLKSPAPASPCRGLPQSHGGKLSFVVFGECWSPRDRIDASVLVVAAVLGLINQWKVLLMSM